MNNLAQILVRSYYIIYLIYNISRNIFFIKYINLRYLYDKILKFITLFNLDPIIYIIYYIFILTSITKINIYYTFI